MIGRRLKLARTAAGLSLRGLEERIGRRATAQAIGRYERDESTPSSGVLTALADALSVQVEHLDGGPGMGLESVEYRRKKIAGKREEARVEAKVLHLLERYLMVEEALGLTTVDWDRPREAPYPVVSHPAEADRAAHGLRSSWGLGLDPIPNLAELMEEHGIKVLSCALGRIDGLTARVRRAGKAIPVLVVNDSDPGERQRLTMARELGHLILEVAPRVDPEKAALRFAGALLMPAEALWAAMGKHRTAIGWEELFELKRLFGVSVEALCHRCKDLRIFSESLHRRLLKEITRFGWRTSPGQEPLSMEGEEPRRFERLCCRALAEGAIAEAKAAELMEVSPRELKQRMEEPPDRHLSVSRWPRARLTEGRGPPASESPARRLRPQPQRYPRLSSAFPVSSSTRPPGPAGPGAGSPSTKPFSRPIIASALRG